MSCPSTNNLARFCCFSISFEKFVIWSIFDKSDFLTKCHFRLSCLDSHFPNKADFVSKCPTQVTLFHFRLLRHPINIDSAHHKRSIMCGCNDDESLQHKQFDSILLLFNFLWKIRRLQHFWQKCKFVHTRFISTSKNLLNCFSRVFSILHILSIHLQNAPQVGRKLILPNSATRNRFTFIPPQCDLSANRTKTWPHNTHDVCGIANCNKSVNGELLWPKNCSKCLICCSKKVHFHPCTSNLTPLLNYLPLSYNAYTVYQLRCKWNCNQVLTIIEKVAKLYQNCAFSAHFGHLSWLRPVLADLELVKNVTSSNTLSNNTSILLAVLSSIGLSHIHRRRHVRQALWALSFITNTSLSLHFIAKCVTKCSKMYLLRHIFASAVEI